MVIKWRRAEGSCCWRKLLGGQRNILKQWKSIVWGQRSVRWSGSRVDLNCKKTKPKWVLAVSLSSTTQMPITYVCVLPFLGVSPRGTKHPFSSPPTSILEEQQRLSDSGWTHQFPQRPWKWNELLQNSSGVQEKVSARPLHKNLTSYTSVWANSKLNSII